MGWLGEGSDNFHAWHVIDASASPQPASCY